MNCMACLISLEEGERKKGGGVTSCDESVHKLEEVEISRNS